MCELFGMSSSVETTVSLSLHEFSQHGGRTNHHADGWGLASYRSIQAQVFREPKPAAFSQKMHFLETHHHTTQCVISHIRHATVGEIALRNTQSFHRVFNGRSHVFAHNGDPKRVQEKISLNGGLPEGETDSEYAFCHLMSNLEPIWRKGEPSLSERIQIIQSAFSLYATFGPANFLYSDGDYLYAFANKRIQPDGRVTPPGMYYLPRKCICDHDSLRNAGVDIGCSPQKVILFASVPLTTEAWQPLLSNHLIIVKNGNLITRRHYFNEQ